MAQLPWHNPDGLEVKFGNYYRDPSNFVNRARVLNVVGSRKTIEVDVDFTLIPTGTTTFTTDLNNDGTAEGFNTGDTYIPANASITDVIFVTSVAATGGTSFTVGTYKLDGTTVSANSLITATEGVLANINAAGKKVMGAGALTATTAGTAGVGANNVFVGITATGTFTAGKGRLIISFLDPLADAAANF